MICEVCRGARIVPGLWGDAPCPECIGGVAGCCDAAGSPDAPAAYVCPRCGAVSFNPNDLRERYCGRCHQFESDRWA